MCVSCETYKTFYGEIGQDTSQPDIHRIDLSYQDMMIIPDFSNIRDMRMLDLSGNTKLDIKATLNAIPKPEQLQVLRLDSLNLETLPDLDRFINLKQLSLIHNPELSWDIVFTSLSQLNLEFLNLKNNNIEQLPISITLLETIKDLNLSYNHLIDSRSYRHLSKLPLLYNLWLDHNDMGILPESIGQLNQVVYFYIGHNGLTTLPEALSGMKSLRVLHTGHNNFIALPEVLIQMKSLFLVHANHNQIADIPEVYFTEKFQLMALILDGNALSENQRKRIKKHFSNFFLLSLDQKNYGYH